MPRDINFLQERRKILTRTQVGDKRLFQISVSFFGIAVAAFLIVVGTRVFYANRTKATLATQQTTRSQILGQEDTEKNYLIGITKLRTLLKLDREKINKQEAISYFSSVFGQNVLVRQIEYTGDDNLLTFRLRSENVFVLEDVFEKLNSNEIKERFIQVTPSNLRRTESGNYEMNVAVVIGETAK